MAAGPGEDIVDWLDHLTPLQALRRAAVRATLAPSVSNSQPWRFVLGGGALEVWADRTRQLPSDTNGRQLLISCGAALVNARAAVAAAGYEVSVDRFPDPRRPDLLARVTAHGGGLPADRGGLGALDAASGARRPYHQRFGDHRVPPGVVADLIAAAAAEDAHLMLVGDAEDRVTTSKYPLSRALDSRHPRAAHAEPTPGLGAVVLLLATAADTRSAWLRTGEALQRILLTATARGYTGNHLDDLLQDPDIRARLAADHALLTHPQAILHIGIAPLTPATRRRRLIDVLTEHP